MSTLGIARPEFLLLLLCAPLLGALLVRAVRAREAALRVFAGGSALSLRSRSRLWIKGGLLVVAFVALVVALAGPYVDLRTRGARRVGVDLVLAIDVSQSMATRDVQPDRLRTARHVAQQLGDEMIGSRLSLVLFAGQGTIRYPATTDPRIVGEVLDNSGKGVRVTQGTSLAAAVASAVAAFAPDSGERGRAIVVVSDGEVTLGDAPDVATLQDAAIRVYAIGVGTPEGGPIPTYDTTTGTFTGYLKATDGTPVTSKLDETSLQALASGSGGRYWRYAGDDAVIGQLASQLRTLDSVATVENAGSVPDERSSWFLALAVVALIVERLLPDRRRVPSPREPKPAARPARRRRILGLAIGSSLLWAAACGSDASRGIEDANARFASGQYQEALSDYRDLQATSPESPQLAVNIGNALHMLGDFTRALPEYAHAIDVAPPDVRAIAQYDRGNTLFRSGRLEDARDAYREALRLDPNDHDAKFNLEVVERLIASRTTTPDPSGASGASGAPNPSGQPGGSGKPGASGQPGGSPQPGPGEPSSDQSPPTNDRTPGDVPPDDLRNALRDFRVGLTLDDALRVLDALNSQDRGVVQLIEGQQLPKQQPQY
ncbi:MAG TPA: tetratricopeptide repeat protein [Candidatus Limnocylindria bacterium]